MNFTRSSIIRGASILLLFLSLFSATAAQSINTLKEQAQKGDGEAQDNLGHAYANGEHDFAQAVVWFRKAAEQGNADAQYNLGVAYYQGRGVPKDYAQALVWYRKAAEQGNATAQFNLGVIYDIGRVVPQDYAQAAVWYRKAAEQGNAGAQFNLGVVYTLGEGVPQDYAQAAVWYRKAAEQGNADAQFCLGMCYAHGKGVPQDYAQAAVWYRKAAEQGYPGAQYNLGIMYENGEGVPKDAAQAVVWYTKAASQSYADARVALSRLNSQPAPASQQNQSAAQATTEPAQLQHDSIRTPTSASKQVVSREQSNAGLKDAERTAVSQERLSSQQLQIVYQHASDAHDSAGSMQTANNDYIALAEALKLYPKLLKAAPHFIGTSPEAAHLLERIEVLKQSLGKNLKPKTSDDVHAMLSVYLDCEKYADHVTELRDPHLASYFDWAPITGVIEEIKQRVFAITQYNSGGLGQGVAKSLAASEQDVVAIGNALNEIHAIEEKLDSGDYSGADDYFRMLTEGTFLPTKESVVSWELNSPYDFSARFPFVREYLQQSQPLQKDIDDYIAAGHLTCRTGMSLSEVMARILRKQELLQSLHSEPLTVAFLEDALISDRVDLTARIGALPPIRLDKASYNIPEQFLTTTSANAGAKGRFLHEKLTDLDSKLTSVSEIRELLAQPSMMDTIGKQCGTLTKIAVEAMGDEITQIEHIRRNLNADLSVVQARIEQDVADTLTRIPKSITVKSIDSRYTIDVMPKPYILPNDRRIIIAVGFRITPSPLSYWWPHYAGGAVGSIGYYNAQVGNWK